MNDYWHTSGLSLIKNIKIYFSSSHCLAKRNLNTFKLLHFFADTAFCHVNKYTLPATIPIVADESTILKLSN